MTTLLSLLSISSMVLQNCFENKVCKKDLNTQNKINLFNIIKFLVCIIVFGLLMFGEKLSVFTLVWAIIFGAVTALGAVYKMSALTTGPMHITLLITTSSMIIPTMSGIFFGEKFSILKLCAVIVLIGFIYLSLDKTNHKKMSGKWVFNSALTFIFLGAVGVVQKIHQTSVHKSETSGFLFITFIFSLIFCLVKNKFDIKFSSFGKKNIIFGAFSGVCTFAMNYINLKLSGILPSQLFFPLINGSVIVISSVLSVILFKEKLSKKQLVGLCGGIISLIAICLVP